MINPNALSLDQIVAWNQATTNADGILMPRGILNEAGAPIKVRDLIHDKLLVATTLWPQTDNNKVNYLFGKGIGSEIALQATPLGRKTKTNKIFEARPHSDFEMYGLSNMEQPYTEEFSRVFGAQEIYDIHSTKAFKDIPNIIDDSQSYEWNGLKLMTPDIELMFLEKLILKENAIYRETDPFYDYELLSQRYSLDFEKINNYLEQYYVKPQSNDYNGRFKSMEYMERKVRKRFQTYVQFGNTEEKALEITKNDFAKASDAQTLNDIIEYSYNNLRVELDKIRKELDRLQIIN